MPKRFLAAVCILSCVCLASSAAEWAAGLLLYSSCDEPNAFSDANGSVKPFWNWNSSPVTSPAIAAEGIGGKALSFGSGARVVLPQEGHWSYTRGSVEFRVRLPEFAAAAAASTRFIIAGQDVGMPLWTLGWQQVSVPVKGPDGKDSGQARFEQRLFVSFRTDLWRTGAETLTVAVPLAAPWKPGEWHHVAAAWDGVNEQIFVDGKSLISGRGDRHFDLKLVGHLPKCIMIGDVASKLPGVTLDELYVYSWPLREADAARAAARTQPNEPLPLPEERQMIVAADIWGPGEQAVLARVDCFNHPAWKQGRIKRVQLEVLDGKGQTIGRETLEQLPDGMEQKLVRASSLPPGEYRLRATAEDADGKPVASALTAAHTVKSYAWLFNRMGEQPGVPAPWTPLSASTAGGKLRFSCWNREHVLAASGLPKSIVTGGREVLAAPVELRWTQGAASGVVEGGRITITRQTPERVEWSVTGARLAGASVAFTGWAEYDGVMYVTMTIDPQSKPLLLDSLTLEVPIRKENSRLIHSVGWNTFWWFGTKRLLSPKPGPVFASDEARHPASYDWFTPYVWIGDDDGGLTWFAENARNWHTNNRNLVTAVRRDDGVTVLQVPLINTPATLDRPTPYEFGFVATPARPLPARWRSWLTGISWKVDRRLADYSSGKYEYIWDDTAANYKSHEFRVGPGDFDGDKWVSQFGEGFDKHPPDPTMKTRGFYPVPYSDAHIVAPSADNFPDFPDFAGEIGCYDGWSMCPSQGFCDYWMWRMAHPWLTRKCIGGIYIDEPYCANANWSTNPFMGAWYDGQGRVQPTWTLLRQRSWLRRILLTQRQFGLEGMTWLHTTANWYPHAYTHATAFMDGEIGSGIRDAKEDIIGYWISGWMRACDRGQPTGLVPLNMGSNIRSEDPGLWRQFIGLVLAHDVLVTGGGDTALAMERAWLCRTDFDIANDDVRFIGYWDNAMATVKLADGQAAPAPPDDFLEAIYGPADAKGKRAHAKQARDNPWRVLVSLYQRPDKALVVVLNYNDAPISGELVLDRKWWRFVRDWQVTDGESGATLAGDRQAIPLTVPARDFRMFWIGPRPTGSSPPPAAAPAGNTR